MPGVFNRQASIADIPHFLSARSAAGLKRAMLEEQRRLKSRLIFDHIQWNSTDKRWYAWYVIDISDSKEVRGD